MSVVGIDFGTTNCTIAAAQKGGVDILTNEVSSRVTPTLAAFGEKERYLGESALTQHQRNIANTIAECKLLIGRRFDEKEVQEYVARSPFKLKDVGNNEIGVEVMYAGERKTFSIIAITAMILQKLREISTKGVEKDVRDVVVSIPSYWTDAQRRAFLDATKIAGMNALRLIHDNTATALQYGIYKTTLSDKDPLRVMFVDMGSHSTQISVVDFLKGQLKVVGTIADRSLGGRDFDKCLVDHFAKEFKDKYKIDVNTNRRAYIRLEVAAEKLKKMLNTVPEAPINIDSIMNDIDVKGHMKRADFEALVKPLLDRLEVPIKKLLQETGTDPQKLSSIEITGGSTRLISVQSKLQEILGREVSKTTNHEESVARGCALQCAILSPLFKVREFAITDLYNYPVNVSWKYAGEDPMNTGENSVEVFSINNQIPSPKQVTIARNRAFDVSVEYSRLDLLPAGTPALIAKSSIPTVPTTSSPDAKIRVKVKLDLNGIIQVESAQIVETLDEFEEVKPTEGAKTEAKPADAKAVDAKPTDAKTADAKPEEGAKPESADKPAEAKETEKKRKVKRTDLKLTSTNTSLSETDLNGLTEEEGKMIASDRLAIETADRKNAVETYVYNMRGKLHDSLAAYSTDAEKTAFSKLLDDTENWLYEDGADVAKSVYVSKLNELQALGNPITRRHQEGESRYEVLSSTRSSIENLKMQATSMDPKYEHIEPAEMEKITKEAESLEKYLRETMSKQDTLPKHADPIVTVADITKKRTELEKLAASILNKPKPKPKVEEKKPEEKKAEEKKPEEKPAEGSADAQSNPGSTPTEGAAPKEGKDDKMDLD